ncbi:MAG: hypothetical protein U9R15_05540 [Chloroflexota bacterium]|nr:hypothetical protein [Chloroflexota bacterium]
MEEVVEEVEVAAAAVVVAVVADRAGWAVQRPLGRAAIAFAPVVGIERRTPLVSLVIRKSAPNAAHR